MPISEMTPRMATNPIGAPDSSSAAATPMSASGRGGEHKEQPLEALQLHHQDRDHDEQHEREDREDAGLGLGAVLDRAARQPRCSPAGSFALNAAISAASEFTTVAASTPGAVSAWTVTVGRRCRRQISGGSSP